jgi:hypothetical protein
MSTRWAAALLVLAAGRTAWAAEAEPPAVVPLVPSIQSAPAPVVSDRRAALGPVSGALTAAAPFVAGCVLWAQNDHIELQKAGTFVMLSGFALAPWVSHGVQGRWRRAAVFGALSTATAAATAIYLEYKDPFEPGYRNIERVPFGMLLTSALFASAAGVVDSFLVAPAPREAP